MSDINNKLILVGKDHKTMLLVQKFAKKHGFHFETYTEHEWATLEEIDQYIQDEELSKQVIHLPVGRNESISLDNMTKKHIEKVLCLKNLNIKEAAKTLKISRATLYRKMEQSGLSLKNERKKMFKKLSENFKNEEEKSFKKINQAA